MFTYLDCSFYLQNSQGGSLAFSMVAGKYSNRSWNPYPWFTSQVQTPNNYFCTCRNIEKPLSEIYSELKAATFLVYFYYTKFFSVLSSYQLTIMVFQAAHLTLILKQVKEQRATNKALREKGEFWIGNFFTAFFFFFSLVTISLMFARIGLLMLT